jgi:hypothetical protein
VAARSAIPASCPTERAIWVDLIVAVFSGRYDMSRTSASTSNRWLRPYWTGSSTVIPAVVSTGTPWPMSAWVWSIARDVVFGARVP